MKGENRYGKRKGNFTSVIGKLEQEVQELDDLIKEKGENIESVSYTGVCGGLLSILCC